MLGQASGRLEKPGRVPYEELNYLVIEDSPMMRTWLRNAIADAGGKRIDVADSYFEALNRIRQRGEYDVVLCDYILSDIRQLNEVAINLAKHGKFKEAIAEFLRLAESNRSVTVYLNAATAIVKLYQEASIKRETITTAEYRQYQQSVERILSYVAKHDPGNVKRVKLMEEWKRLAQNHRA